MWGKHSVATLFWESVNPLLYAGSWKGFCFKIKVPGLTNFSVWKWEVRWHRFRDFFLRVPAALICLFVCLCVYEKGVRVIIHWGIFDYIHELFLVSLARRVCVFYCPPHCIVTQRVWFLYSYLFYIENRNGKNTCLLLLTSFKWEGKRFQFAYLLVYAFFNVFLNFLSFFSLCISVFSGEGPCVNYCIPAALGKYTSSEHGNRKFFPVVACFGNKR